MKENQKIMYDNFLRLSTEGKTDIQRKNCKGYAAEILKSFPDFEKGAPAKPAAPVEPEKPKDEATSPPGGN